MHDDELLWRLSKGGVVPPELIERAAERLRELLRENEELKAELRAEGWW